MSSHITYQLQYRKCGKLTCHCHDRKDPGHGPYWYGYYRMGKELRSFYVGKLAPREQEQKEQTA